MIEYQEYSKSFMLTCDKCGRHDAVRTARCLNQAKRIASAFFKWAMDTPLGVLCPSCTILWRDGVLERVGARDARRIA